MKVLVDAVGCTFGGIATYQSQLLAQWVRDHPQDELLVLQSERDTPAPDVATRTIAVIGPEPIGRPVAVTRAMRKVNAEWRPDAVLALRPATSLSRLAAPIAVVVHDLRHELRPEQFTRARRAIRWASYGRSYAIADGFICISRRTRDDLLRCHPRLSDRPAAVIYHGADHVESWRPGPDRRVIAFGHHTNKNADLVLNAWRCYVETDARSVSPATLKIVGLASARRHELARQVTELGIEHSVELAEYLDDATFQGHLAGAAAVLYPSDFEGFGLPAIESMRLGVPVVIGPEPALSEVSSGHAFIASDWSAESLGKAIRDALAASGPRLAAARDHAMAFTWSRTVRETRAFLETLAQRSR